VPQAPKVDGEWTCSLCMLQNSAAMTDKCSICEAPRPKPAGSAPSSITNLPLAPVRPPTAPIFALPAHLTQKKDDGSWECSACMLRNPATAVDTCLICDTKRS
jgi:nuclear pore complex protein Nup153